MLNDVFRWMKGCVEFKVKSKFPERFINLTSRNGVRVWNTLPCEGGLSGGMSAADYRRIRPTARKSGAVLRVTRKYGLPFIICRHRDRCGLLLGAALGLGLLFLLSNFVWTFTVNGNTTLTENEILSALNEEGLARGSFRDSIDVPRVNRALLSRLDKLSWASVNLTGCKAEIAVKEKAEKPELTDYSSPCNIKASADGVITKIKADEGQTLTSVGSGVVKGELLVSGVVETKLDLVRYVRARAEVYADVISEKEISIPEQTNYYSLTENYSERLRMIFLNFEFPCSMSFTRFDNSAATSSQSLFSINSVPLPLGFKTETARELKKGSGKLDRKTATLRAQTELLLYELFERGESKLVSRETELKNNNAGYVCSVKYVFNENIAQSVDFSVTDSE